MPKPYEDMKNLGDVPTAMLDQIEAFFVSYNEQRGKVFTAFGRCGVAEALNATCHASSKHVSLH